MSSGGSASLEPDHAVLGQHRRRAERPLEAVRPELLRAARVDHQLAVVADRVARGLDELLVVGIAAAAEGPPAELERPEPARLGREQDLAQAPWLVEDQRPVRLDAVAVAPAHEPADGLAGVLAEDVPERDVDAADRMGHAAAAPGPVGRLVELLREALRLDRDLVAQERLEQGQRAVDQRLAGVAAAAPDQAGVGVDLEQGVGVVARAAGAGPAESDRAHRADPWDGGAHEVASSRWPYPTPSAGDRVGARSRQPSKLWSPLSPA